mmetsp:Transcript_142631/g.248714  ORF Transcript_142631/g.248714 Transcript_142631/m.248714 type:complete len:424 (+) Transcript_142631:75-1346(+)
MDALLERLPDGATVAVVSMLGSLCPITRGHVQCYIEARRILLDQGPLGVERPKRLEHFDECLGLISLNGDFHVGYKLKQKGQKALDIHARANCVRLAIADIPWLELESDGFGISELERRWPKLKFEDFDMNGADDVVKYSKWQYTSARRRMITIGRPGYTELVLKGMKKDGIDPDDGNCFLSRELPDISSTAAREASARGDSLTLLSLLHPQVADWLLKQDGHAGLPAAALACPAVEADAETVASAQDGAALSGEDGRARESEEQLADARFEAYAATESARRDVEMLKEVLQDSYFIDNSELRSTKDGLVYRYTKDVTDISGNRASWGSYVDGIEEGEWLNVPSQNLFLPIFVAGKKVLKKHSEVAAAKRPSRKSSRKASRSRVSLASTDLQHQACQTMLSNGRRKSPVRGATSPLGQRNSSS